jgi:M6 family metalloprotease-like protein
MPDTKFKYRWLRLTGLLILTAFAAAGAGDLNDLKQQWKTSRPILDKIKQQPRRYKDAVSKMNLLGRVREVAKSKGREKSVPDTIHVLAIKAQFQLDNDTNTTGDGHFDYSGNGQPMYIGGDWRNGHNLDYEPPHDSLYIHNQMLALRNYYLKISGGRLWIEFEQWPKADTSAYTLPHQMSFYSDFYNGGENWGAGLYVLLRDAVDAAGSDPGNCSFSTGSGAAKVPKAVMIFHAGSCWQTDPYGADIPSVFLQMDSSSPIIVKAGADTIYEGIIDAETQSQDGMVLGSQGEIAHEFGHQLGLPDLYDYSMYSAGLGEWELMSYGSWNMNAYVPPHLSAWCKVFLGWSQLKTLKPGDDIQVAFKWVADSNSLNNIVKIPINSHEYYLIENRRAWVDPNSAITDSASAESNGARVWRNGVLIKVNDYDMSLPFELDAGGLLVWHVDDDLIAQRWADNSLETGDVKAIYLLEADHVQDLQRWGGSPYSTYASPYDAYYAGNNDRLDDGSDPASVANDGSYTHISISGITAPSENMSARVKVGWSLPGFPYDLGQKVDWNSPNYAVLGDTVVLIISGNDGRVYAIKSNGQGLFNKDTILIWPNDTVKIRAEFARVNGNIYSSPAVGDVNKDGRPEVFVSSAYSSTKGYIWGFSFDTLNVQYLTDSSNEYSLNLAVSLGGFPDSTHGPIFSSPTLADINGDDTLEIMVACDDDSLYAWHYDGRRVTGFPKYLAMETRATPSIANLTGSSDSSEIAILSGDSRVFGINGSGQDIPGFPALGPWVDWVTASTAIGDINRDGSPEIVACPKNQVTVLDNLGRTVSGWPVLHVQTAIASPALGDLDGDGYLEIVAAIGTKLYAYNYNGTLISGFPRVISESLNVQSSPVTADVDNDGLPEIIIGSPDGRVYAFNGNGTNAAGFPLTAGGKILSTPMLADLDGDSSDIELAVGCDDGHLYVWSIGSPVNASLNNWPMFCGNQAHTGFLNWDPALHPLPARSGELINNAYVYPNPARGEKAFVRFYLDNASGIDVKIFNLAGELVRQYSQPGLALSENEVVWDLKNPREMASGVYIIRVEANDGIVAKVKICKAAVIK